MVRKMMNLRTVGGVPWPIIMLLFGVALGIISVQFKFVNYGGIGFTIVGTILLAITGGMACVFEQGMATGIGFSLIIIVLSYGTPIEYALSLAFVSFIYIYVASISGKTDRELITGAVAAVIPYELLRIILISLMKYTIYQVRDVFTSLIRDIAKDLLIMIVIFPLVVILMTRYLKITQP